MNKPTPAQAASAVYFNTLMSGAIQFAIDGGTEHPVWYWRTGLRMWMAFTVTVAYIHQAISGDE